MRPEGMYILCQMCRGQAPLDQLAELPCACTLCAGCLQPALMSQVQAGIAAVELHAQPPGIGTFDQHQQAVLSKGCTVLYLNKALGKVVPATVVDVDRSCDPPQYGISFAADHPAASVGGPTIKFTERGRLMLQPGSPGPQSAGVPSLSTSCPRCQQSISHPQLQHLCPDAFTAFEAACTRAWLQRNNIITCPHPGCGALIQCAGGMPLPHAKSTHAGMGDALSGSNGAAAKAAAAATAAATGRNGAASAVRDRSAMFGDVMSRVYAGLNGQASAASGSPAKAQRNGSKHASNGAANAGGTGRNSGFLGAPIPPHSPPPAAHCGAAAEEFRIHAEHKRQHRYRCGACKHDFCDACRRMPYHDRFTCEQAAAPDCLFCTGKVHCPAWEHLAAVGSSGGSSGSSSSSQAFQEAAAAASSSDGLASLRPSELRTLAKVLGLDTSYVLEKDELLQLTDRYGHHVCGGDECRAKVRQGCCRQLPCGHWCCGVRSELRCPPCIMCPTSGGVHDRGDVHASASHAAMGAGQQCLVCWEPLMSAPCIQMSCGAGHMLHLACAKQRLQAGYPGPSISFTHLFCPQCGSEEARSGNVQVALGAVHLDHPTLAAALEPHLQLRTSVVGLAKLRLHASGAARAESALQPGGKYDGRPADWALSTYTFYRCHRCTRPYFGGLRACGAAAGADPVGAAQQGGQYDPKELLCGSCAVIASGKSAACPKHGSDSFEWKCRFCCNVASFFCFGTTHMCAPCHARWPTVQHHQCAPARCTLRIPHPQPGKDAAAEYCLGCGMCRAAAGGG